MRLWLFIAAGLLGSLAAWYVFDAWSRAELKVAEEKEQHAKELQEQIAKNDKQRQEEREEHAKANAASAELIEKLSQSIATRDAEAARLRSRLLAPKPPADVQKDAKDQL